MQNEWWLVASSGIVENIYAFDSHDMHGRLAPLNEW